MIHGGGHMMLSKKAIRPYQCTHLLERGFLPVSINYRLCPETTLDGTMEDILDNLKWIRSALPGIAQRRNLDIDPSNIVAMGWSAGGHLAMSLGWKATQARIAPPSAVLAFYPPSDYEAMHWWLPIDVTRLEPTMSMAEILNRLPKDALQEYHIAPEIGRAEGWIELGDAWSELVLHSVRDGLSIPLLLRGLDMREDAPRPSKEEIAAISPLHHVRSGSYQVPTYIIHGTGDKLVPADMSVALHDTLKQKGIATGLTLVPETSHTFDLFLKPGERRGGEYVKPGLDFVEQAVQRGR